MKQKKSTQRFVVCIQNEDCEDLEPRKIDQVLPDDSAAEVVTSEWLMNQARTIYILRNTS